MGDTRGHGGRQPDESLGAHGGTGGSATDQASSSWITTDLAPILPVALAGLRAPLDDAASRFDVLARAIHGGPQHDALLRVRRGVLEAKRVLDSFYLLTQPSRQPERVAPNELVPAVVSIVKETFASPTVNVMEFLPQDLPAGLAVPAALRYALLNLAVAAIRAAGAGMVVVIARAADTGGFEIEVDDPGPPVAREGAEEVFQPTAEESGRRSGLALYLAHKLAQSARVKLDVIERSKGGAFVLRVPPV